MPDSPEPERDFHDHSPFPAARPLRATRLAAALALTLGTASTPAQQFGVPGVPIGPPGDRQIEDFGERALPRPGFSPGKAPTVGLPRPAAPAAGERAPGGPRILLREVRVTGNTVLPEENLRSVTAPYVGRSVSSEDLETLRLALTRLYVDRGYINSGAVIPDQKVSEGVVEVRIVEGRLTDIQVTGNQRLDSEYVSERLALGAGPPLNVKGVQEQLQILLQGPFIQRINAELEPGDRPGEARLRAQVEEAPPVRLSVGTDTDLSPALGEARAVVRGQAFSPLGRGDVLTGEVAVASGLQDYILDYAIPLNARDLTLSVFGEWTSSKVVRGELEDLDIRAESSTLAFRLSQPVYRTSQEQLTLAAGLDLRQSTTWLLDERFAFSPGVESDGESHVTVLRLVADWVTRSRTQVLAARSTLSWGIDAFGATDNSGGLPDGEFVAWLGQFQWARRLGESDSQLVFRFDGQLTSHPLLPLEQFAVGGLTSVRGYRTNEIVRDRGYIASLEVRVPVLRREDGNPMLQIVPFVDAGGAWYKGYSTPDPNRITSAGLGLRWDPAPPVHAEVYYGQNFQGKGIPDDPSGLQNTGWSFLLTADLLTW